MASGALKIGIGAALFAGIIYLATRSSALVKEFAFRVAGFGLPSLNGWLLSVPVVIEFNNFIGLPLNVDKVSGILSVWIGAKWVQVATFSQPVTILPGEQTITVNTVIDLKKFAAANLANVALTIMQTRKVFLRAEINAQYGMLNIPSEPFEKELSV